MIEVFNDLINGGTSFKANNGFKPWFLNTVVEKHKAKLPESDLKAQPHVHSLLRHFKGVYNVVHDMNCTSGFRRDPKTKLVVGEKEVLEANAKRKTDPYYEDLYIIFVKNGEEIKDEEENEESSKKDEPKFSYGQEPSGVETSSREFGNLVKWVRASDNLVKGLSEVASILEKEISAASSNITQVISFNVKFSEKHSKLNEELANLGLTTMERH
ncbi:LOW QUALITY PROTEIN: hypothetical protein Cgig2_003818 [Carnegiea gigantea]|uniref:Uncharacterized protein n=1 Tax=Carnegiea gigantea TaxID=171969 RepID=A0A9Q1JJ17_9CARY|nr:LOW QUALITY PROTEIN: hypothetical protein Cgig2_003818 [Carnegiea gigantea]